MGHEVTDEDVKIYEGLADLDLKADRRKAVAGILSVWVPAANELSRKMAEPQHRSLIPGVRFTHSGIEEVSEL